jgi:RNA polymerase sigma factor (sigma-70 family)
MQNTKVVLSRSQNCVQDSILCLLAKGDELIWDEVVKRYGRLVRSSVRAILTGPDGEDAVQATWLALLRGASSIRDPQRLPGWLAITARREALAIAQRRRRETPMVDVGDRLAPMDDDNLAGVLRGELQKALVSAIEALPRTQRSVMQALLHTSMSYDRLSRELQVPRGSIGPTRARAIANLRHELWPEFV